MRIFSYSPSCEAYAETNSGVFDLSQDITSMQVDRQSDGYSTFSIRLQNKNWKYNGFFTPMDRIVLYCTKESRYKLFSGFVTDCDVFSLYQGDFSIKGKCSLYRIENLYWDPGLLESQEILRYTRNTNDKWAGYGETIYTLLTEVGGWPGGNIMIGDVPGEAIDFAQEMYQASFQSGEQLKSMANEFYEILQTHGPSVSTGSSTAAGNVDLSNIAAFEDLPDDVKKEIKGASQERQEAIARAFGEYGKPYVWGATGPESYDCSGFVGYCLTNSHNRLGTTQTFIQWNQPSSPKPADVAVSWEHTGLYLGGGIMIHCTGGVGVTVGDVQSDMVIVQYFSS